MLKMRKHINKDFTALVNTFIQKGYTFSPTMSGHQGEEMKVDLDNGKETVRIRLERECVCVQYYEEVLYCDCLDLIAESFDKVGKDTWTTLWNGKGEKIYYQRFYTLRDGVYETDKNFIKQRLNIRHTRYKLRRDVRKTTYNYLDTQKAKKVVLAFVRRQPGCKNKTVNDIISIRREYNSYGKYYYSVRVTKGKGTQVLYMTAKAAVV